MREGYLDIRQSLILVFRPCSFSLAFDIRTNSPLSAFSLRRCCLSVFLGRVALGAQRPIVIKLSRGRSVGLSMCRSAHAVHCGKTANRIRMPFGVIGRTGPGMRHLVGFGDRSTGRGTFGGEFGARHCTYFRSLSHFDRVTPTAPFYFLTSFEASDQNSRDKFTIFHQYVSMFRKWIQHSNAVL